MAQLIYATITSLDGFIEDQSGDFDWAVPDAEVHSFINELERTVGASLYGRRTYETMAVWQTIGNESTGASVDQSEVSAEELDYGRIWRASDKVVYSRTLPAVWTPRTELLREFDPAAVRRIKDTVEGDLSISGPTLAAHAFAAGLVDQVHVFMFPIIIGGGKPGIALGHRLGLDLIDSNRFGNGVVHMHYRANSA